MISDHTAQEITLYLEPEYPQNISKRSYSKENKRELLNSLECIGWSDAMNMNPPEVNKQWELFHDTISFHFNNCFSLESVPTKTKYTEQEICNDPEVIECKRRLDIPYVLANPNVIFKEQYKDIKAEI
ncbi:hypothetical protein JTB14_007543 [Gonioctena quinquepunctata]|nr:hypothetical protein JTB14_007543 [Gonioctena quinquepunctata]